MAKKERTDNMSERFFIKATPDVKKALAHLAIDLDASVEKLAGFLLAHALERADDIRAGRLKTPDLSKKPSK